jgi:hypothetical protein
MHDIMAQNIIGASRRYLSSTFSTDRVTMADYAFG